MAMDLGDEIPFVWVKVGVHLVLGCIPAFLFGEICATFRYCNTSQSLLF